MATPRRHPHPLSRSGFTLIETISAIVILATVMTVCSRLIITATSGYTDAATRAELHAQLSSALERIVTELRETEIKPSSAPVAPDLTGVTPTSIGWKMANSATRSVTLTGPQVLLTTESISNIVLADNVTVFDVQCYDESNTALATTLAGSALDTVRRVQITITATSNGVTETLRTRVFLRAMMAGGASS